MSLIEASSSSSTKYNIPVSQPNQWKIPIKKLKLWKDISKSSEALQNQSKNCTYINLHYTHSSMKSITFAHKVRYTFMYFCQMLETRVRLTLFTLVPLGTRICRILEVQIWM